MVGGCLGALELVVENEDCGVVGLYTVVTLTFRSTFSTLLYVRSYQDQSATQVFCVSARPLDCAGAGGSVVPYQVWTGSADGARAGR